MKPESPSRAELLTCRRKRGNRLRPREQGVALIMSLLLLSVITFMAVTFLVVSRSEKGAVTTSTDQAIARLAADAALERAKAELIAPMMAWTNPFIGGLIVSTNYFNPHGFVSGNAAYTNVNYDRMANGQALSEADRIQNIANLFYAPRPPVYITTGSGAVITNEFRYYLDLNRNGVFEPTGLVGETNEGRAVLGPGNLVLSNWYVGDPQWIGGLERADQPHSASNQFVLRYSYLVAPAGQTLDINYIHNQARNPGKNTMDPFGTDFMRNQGVGTWEINLAAFLHDLNTNTYAWGGAYLYEPVAGYVQGNAFTDAASILAKRYGGAAYNLAALASVQGLYGRAGESNILNDGFDGYSAGPLMITNYLPTVDPDRTTANRVGRPWPGASSTNHFFSPSDFLDGFKTSPAFTNRLILASLRTNDTYDRTTFYRMLEQLGTESAPEPPKLNLNYINVDRFGTVVPNMETNFLGWQATALTNPATFFFTNVADRLLLNAGYNFTTKNIQIWPTNYYTPAVHRLLQVAANIYDATTTRRAPGVTNAVEFPTVFRPLYTNYANTVWIKGFAEVTTNTSGVLQAVPRDLAIPADRQAVTAFDIVYGVPLVVGAKKGLPNFNEFAMQTHMQVLRKLQFLRRGPQDALPWRTNQMYLLGISNVFGVEAWNSYTNPFPRNLEMRVASDVKVMLTNELGQVIINLPINGTKPGYFTFATNMAVGANTWQGFRDPMHAEASFRIPLSGGFMPLPQSVYLPTTKPRPLQFGQVGGPEDRFENPSFFPVPRWWAIVNTKVRFILVDTAADRIVDYVNLDSWEDPIDITEAITRYGQCGPPYTPDASDGSMWCTNRFGGYLNVNSPTFGVMNQISIGMGLITPPANNWNSLVQQSPPGQDRQAAIDFFRYQFGLSPLYNSGETFYRSNSFYAPFVPVRNLYLFTSWNANDPLVHYTIGDLMESERTNRLDFTTNYSTIANLGRINRRYEPWGGNALSQSASPTTYDLAVKDPQITRSDDWEFPTNKFPNVGWLGRVHRGTPWQTMYLKAPVADVNTWRKWSGGAYFVRNLGQLSTNVVPLNTLFPDSDLSQPWRDRYIIDLFTASVNENATHGQLSVNQTNLAAWSAVLSGVPMLTNVFNESSFNADPYLRSRYAALFVPPAGVYRPGETNPAALPALVRIVSGINATRATNAFTQPFKLFRRVGEILATPELTVASPFLNTNSAVLTHRGINDAAYERIPQQILGLLKADPTPRFVVYSYGQALKPADRSLVPSGRFFQLCTNYQVTAELATRAVVRVEGVPPYPAPLSPAPALTNLNVVVESFNVLPPE